MPCCRYRGEAAPLSYWCAAWAKLFIRCTIGIAWCIFIINFASSIFSAIACPTTGLVQIQLVRCSWLDSIIIQITWLHATIIELHLSSPWKWMTWPHFFHQFCAPQVNFETFGRAMQLLFRLTTSAGWNDVLEPLLVTPPYCDPNYRDLPNGNCGHPFVAIVYFVSFIIINYMIVINMYIAIILENFNQAHQEEEIGIVEEDLEMFYTKWAK